MAVVTRDLGPGRAERRDALAVVVPDPAARRGATLRLAGNAVPRQGVSDLFVRYAEATDGAVRTVRAGRRRSETPDRS